MNYTVKTIAVTSFADKALIEAPSFEDFSIARSYFLNRAFMLGLYNVSDNSAGGPGYDYKIDFIDN